MSFQGLIKTRVVHDDRKLTIVKTQNVDEALKAIDGLRENTRKNSGPGRGRHVGSVPVVLALAWAKEWGCAPGSAEWNRLAAARLRSDEFFRLRVHG
jgi:hypothetical protein